MSVNVIHIPAQWKLEVSRIVKRVLIYALLLVGAVVVSVPFYWLLRSSLLVEGDLYVWPPILWPSPIIWQNYVDIFQVPFIPMPLFFKNSIILVTASVIGDVVSSSLVAFSLGRLRWWGRDVIFAALIATMFLPYQVTMIPIFLGFHRLGLLNTLWPIIIPSWFGHAFYIFLMRQFIMTIPLELDDAIRIDGGGTFHIYWHLILPLSKPGLITVAIFSFQAKWTQFLQPLIYISEIEKQPLAVGIRVFKTLLGRAEVTTGLGWNHVMAATVVFIIPIIIVFFLAQRAFMQGIVVSGVKG